MRKIRQSTPTKYSPSKTKPGQALIPSELLKRHLAGTLPDIQKIPLFTHDENGQQISEDLSHLELHELHNLTVAMKSEIRKRQQKLDEEAEENYKKKIIDEHSQLLSSKQLHPEGAVGTEAVSASETEQQATGQSGANKLSKKPMTTSHPRA